MTTLWVVILGKVAVVDNIFVVVVVIINVVVVALLVVADPIILRCGQ